MSLLGPRPPLTYHPWPIEEYTEEQLHIVEKKEALGQVSPDILRLKARLLMEDNQAVTALDILLNIFDNFQNDLFVVDAMKRMKKCN